MVRKVKNQREKLGRLIFHFPNINGKFEALDSSPGQEISKP